MKTGTPRPQDATAAVHDPLLHSGGTAVADPFALYRISTAHTPRAARLRESVRQGALRLVTPAVAFTVACGMHTCWDENCDQEHRPGTSSPAGRFHGLDSVEIADLNHAELVSAGQLFARCADHRITGAEVLAACHCALLSRSLGAPLVSAARAAYCYRALPEAQANGAIELV
ncbi:hypothetical protein [Streptomyces sp. NBC_00557]|uniref:hypothetical protein n=1 Tax=Streptomyces sp. NBC_00557 TaxID=2975776 RepID=UPI002E8127DB|nr:hypothetical protein [Streptomyces sp. NBC_00557]WUC39483.1 hypothetical protein OG956_37420 [Streptomyces sp. NBC_00557]